MVQLLPTSPKPLGPPIAQSQSSQGCGARPEGRRTKNSASETVALLKTPLPRRSSFTASKTKILQSIRDSMVTGDGRHRVADPRQNDGFLNPAARQQ